jgi:DMSO/TMAO reductase YedYZ molybdopterin-dependent catalytic subunit
VALKYLTNLNMEFGNGTKYKTTAANIVPLKIIVELVKPHSSVTTVAFFSFGEDLYGGAYYDTHSLENCLKAESILLRVENQLGYKMVKWISSIEFLKDAEHTGKGFGGKNEDDEYHDLLADT